MFGVAALLAWEAAVRVAGTPPYILPGPIAIARAFVASPGSLLAALGSTLSVTAMALVAAAALGAALALAMSASRLARDAIQPWAVALQVTPIVAIVPLVIIWVGHMVSSPQLATATVLVVSATIVAFFPVFANTAAGLDSAPAELADLFRLYGASRWQTLRLLRLPAALPYFLAGLRISGGLALVGAVVAEFVAGSGGFASGLAYTIQEAGISLAGAAHVRSPRVAGLGRGRHQRRAGFPCDIRAAPAHLDLLRKRVRSFTEVNGFGWPGGVRTGSIGAGTDAGGIGSANRLAGASMLSRRFARR